MKAPPMPRWFAGLMCFLMGGFFAVLTATILLRSPDKLETMWPATILPALACLGCMVALYLTLRGPRVDDQAKLEKYWEQRRIEQAHNGFLAAITQLEKSGLTHFETTMGKLKYPDGRPCPGTYRITIQLIEDEEAQKKRKP